MRWKQHNKNESRAKTCSFDYSGFHAENRLLIVYCGDGDHIGDYHNVPGERLWEHNRNGSWWTPVYFEDSAKGFVIICI